MGGPDTGGVNAGMVAGIGAFDAVAAGAGTVGVGAAGAGIAGLGTAGVAGTVGLSDAAGAVALGLAASSTDGLTAEWSLTALIFCSHIAIRVHGLNKQPWITIDRLWIPSYG